MPIDPNKVQWDSEPKLDASQVKWDDEQPKPGRSTDGANAIGTGFFRGLTRLAGLPVDTAVNVLDLGKAAIGAPYIALTGKTVPQWLEPTNREQAIGSGDNLLKNVRKSEAGAFLVDPQNPAYEGGYLQNAGAALTGVARPNSMGQLANQLLLSQGGAAAGKAAYDATGNAALGIAAGLSPLGAQTLGTAAVKRAVRGGEAGRVQMAQRVQDLKNAGVDNPTLGLASGNAVLGGVENLLQNTPGAVGIMGRSRQAAIDGMERAATRAADLASSDRGVLQAGQAIQKGAASFKNDSFKQKQTALYNKLDNYIDGQKPVDVGNTRSTLADLNSDIRGAPELSKQFKNSRIMAIEDAIDSDVGGSRATPAVLSPILGANGQNFVKAAAQPAGLPTNKLPFEAVKKTRTLVGNEIADNSLMSNVPRSKWNPLYGALSDDMQAAAVAAGPGAEGALNRANQFTRSGLNRLERIAPIIDRPAPEQSFKALEQTLKENTSTFQAVKKSLPEDARGSFAGTIIERLGKATPGQQNETGTRWSQETFLTNWNRISPSAQRELLSGIPNAREVKALVDDVAKSASMMRDSSKLWSNPSGTSANAAARGTLGLIGAGGAGAIAGLLNPLVPIGAAAGVGGVNLTARGLTSQRIRNAMLNRTDIDPELLAATLIPMAGTRGLLDEPKQ